MKDYYALIKKYQMEIQWPDDEAEKNGDISVFPYKEGGYWGYGKTLEKAIDNCMKTNKLR